MLRRSVLLALAASVALSTSACKTEMDERQMVVQANAYAVTGRVDEARALFDQAYAANPESTDVLIGYVAFAIDNEDLDRASEMFEALDALELNANEQGRVDSERGRYWTAILETAEGDAPQAPADIEQYEAAMIGLIQLDRRSPRVGEWGEYMLVQARMAVGAEPDQELIVDDPYGPLARVDAASARASLSWLERLQDGDDRLEVIPRLDEAEAREVAAARRHLERVVFDADFDEGFESNHQAAFVAAERYDAEAETFTIAYAGDFVEGLDGDADEEVLLGTAQTLYGREIATDIVYELRGAERGEAEPLPYRLADFSEVVVTEPGTNEEEQFTFGIAIPYAVIRKGAWMLEQRMQAAAAAADEGDEGEEAAAPAEGSGAAEAADDAAGDDGEPAAEEGAEEGAAEGSGAE